MNHDNEVTNNHKNCKTELLRKCKADTNEVTSYRANVVVVVIALLICVNSSGHVGTVS